MLSEAVLVIVLERGSDEGRRAEAYAGHQALIDYEYEHEHERGRGLVEY